MQVTLKDITFSYDQIHKTFAHLNWVIPDGKLVALLGPSGSGKTSILNLVAGLLTPTSGQILFNEVDVTKQDIRNRNIGMVFQDYALYPQLNVLDNIAFPLKMAHVKKAKRHEQARKLAKLVHVDNQLAKLPNTLSGGQQQRVAIARALAKQPAILLLDEPLSNLDAALRIDLRNEIRRIQLTTGVTTIFVTHDQNDALQIADQIVVLQNGHIQQIGTGEELYHHPHNLFVSQFIGTPKLNTVSFADISSYINTSISKTILNQAVTVGIRSESISAHPIKQPLVTNLPVTITQQKLLGREKQTYIKFKNMQWISTTISENIPALQNMSVSINANGCYFFDQNGICIWSGGDLHV